jgi:hypothetical protein
MSRKSIGLTALAAVLSGQLLLSSFRRGWTNVETDFPNYYTAAVLTLQHQPLRNFYEWTWFQRQMNYTGTERQLGGYIPHTPLTMVPMLPLARLSPQRAKQVWLLLGLLFTGLSIWLLARMAEFRPLEVLLVALLARTALQSNFILGQYYLFVLFLLTLAAWCLLRGKHLTAGALLGIIFAVKLYTAPFLFYFAVRRQWRALGGMMASIAVLASVAVAIFGFDALWFFVTTVMRRALDGCPPDPYNPGCGSMITFFARGFVSEPELNRHPLFAAPGLFFFLRAFYSISVLGLSLLALRRRDWEEGRAFAWFVIVLFALSSSVSSYNLVLLLVPVILLLRRAPILWSFGLLSLYALIQVPLPWYARLLQSWYPWAFPKAWLLLILLIYTGWSHVRNLRRMPVAVTLAVVLIISMGEAVRRWSSYRDESTRLAAPAVINPGSVFSSSPVANDGRLLYEHIARGRYLLRSSGADGLRDFAFDGEAFRPAMAASGEPIYFELVAAGHSRICAYRPSTQTLEVAIGPALDPQEPAVSADGTTLAFVSRGSLCVLQRGRSRLVFPSRNVVRPAFFPDGDRIAFAEGQPGYRSIRAISISGGKAETLTNLGDCFAPAISPDGRLLAYVMSETGARQVWIEDLVSHARYRVTSGACNNDSPAWRGNSRSIVFASDCGRGPGLPALYIISIDEYR